MPDKLNGIIFSEILADNPNGFNTNNSTNPGGQPTANKQDEFIEFTNTSNQAINMDGYQVWSDKLGLLHTFNGIPTSAIVQPGETIVVVGEFDPNLAANATLTNYYEANGPAPNAAGGGPIGGGFLEDGEGTGGNAKNDTLYLVDADGDYIRFSYGAQIDIPATLPTGFPGGGTLQGTGEQLQDSANNTIPFIRDANGDFIVSPTPTPGPGVAEFVCFTSGTLITTDQGQIAVEDLTPDMRILTRDCGYARLRAVRGTKVEKSVLMWNPEVCPIIIPAGTVDNLETLVVSPAHRLLVAGPSVSLLCGTAEAFVAAHHFVGLAGVTRAPANRPVTYFHLLLDDHHIIQSNGAWTESLFLGDVAHAALRATEEWACAGDVDINAMTHSQTARVVLKRFEALAVLSDMLPQTQDATEAA